MTGTDVTPTPDPQNPAEGAVARIPADAELLGITLVAMWMTPSVMARLGLAPPFDLGLSAFHPVMLFFGLTSGLVALAMLWLFRGASILLVRFAVALAAVIVLPWSSWIWTRESLSDAWYPISNSDVGAINAWSFASFAICLTLMMISYGWYPRAAETSHQPQGEALWTDRWQFSLAELFACVSSLAAVLALSCGTFLRPLPNFYPPELWSLQHEAGFLATVGAVVIGGIVGMTVCFLASRPEWSRDSWAKVFWLSVLVLSPIAFVAAFASPANLLFAPIPAIVAEISFVALGVTYLKAIDALVDA